MLHSSCHRWRNRLEVNRCRARWAGGKWACCSCGARKGRGVGFFGPKNPQDGPRLAVLCHRVCLWSEWGGGYCGVGFSDVCFGVHLCVCQEKRLAARVKRVHSVWGLGLAGKGVAKGQLGGSQSAAHTQCPRGPGACGCRDEGHCKSNSLSTDW
jgi:hypothetical protein